MACVGSAEHCRLPHACGIVSCPDARRLTGTSFDHCHNSHLHLSSSESSSSIQLADHFLLCGQQWGHRYHSTNTYPSPQTLLTGPYMPRMQPCSSMCNSPCQISVLPMLTCVRESFQARLHRMSQAGGSVKACVLLLCSLLCAHAVHLAPLAVCAVHGTACGAWLPLDSLRTMLSVAC